MPKMENDFWKRAKEKVMFIEVKNSITVPVGWIYQRMRLLHRRSGVSTDRRTTWFF